MQKPPHAATSCPNQNMAGVLYRLENLTWVGFCHLCYALGSNCGCSRATHQAPCGYRGRALWVPPQLSYASMASSMITTASTSMRGVLLTGGPPPGFPARRAPSPMDVSPAPQNCHLLAHAGVGRGLRPQSMGNQPGHGHLAPEACTKNDPRPSVNQLPPQEVMRQLQPPHTSRRYTHLSR